MIRGSARLRVMEFVLVLDSAEAEQVTQKEIVSDRLTELQNQLHAELLRRLDLRLGAFSTGTNSTERTEKLNGVLDDLLDGEFKTPVFESDLSPLILSRALRARLMDWIFTRLAKDSASLPVGRMLASAPSLKNRSAAR